VPVGTPVVQIQHRPYPIENITQISWMNYQHNEDFKNTFKKSVAFLDQILGAL